MKKTVKIGLVVLVLAAVLVAGFYWWSAEQQPASAMPPRVVGWGTIESETLKLKPELGDRIIALYAEEGDEVEAGDLLVQLDSTAWQQQRDQAAASLAKARATLAEVRRSARTEAVIAAQAEVEEAQAARDGAYAVWQTAQSIVNNPLALKSRVDDFRNRIDLLQKQVEAAEANLKEATIQRDQAYRNQSSDEAITTYQSSQQKVDAARANLNAAQAELAGAKEELALLVEIQNNPLELISQANAAKTGYQKAEAVVEMAKARLAEVKARSRPEEVARARAGVKKAEAALDQVEIQIDKLNLTAPQSGVILERIVDVGELANPGDVLMELGNLDRATLEVFIAETEIGHVRLGQTAQVSVDAYPDETFEGSVTFIAQEAEFTPQNVQTKEERVNLVFAVEISLANPDRRLMPGMPAKAEILIDSQAPTPEATATPTGPAQTDNATPTPRQTPLTTTPTVTPSPTRSAPQMQAEVTAWALNVREGPGVEHPVIGGLTQGETVPVLKVNPGNGWLQIQLPGSRETGWISGSEDFVKVIE